MTDKKQLDKFKEAAPDLEADDDPKRFDERLARTIHEATALGSSEHDLSVAG